MENTRDEKTQADHDGPTFDLFVEAMRDQLETSARSKNYSQQGADGENLLYRSVQRMTGGHHHALSEIIYKCHRFLSRENPIDLVKIGSWAFLAWRHYTLDHRRR